MKTLRELVRAIFALADAIYLLATAISPSAEEENALREERFKRIMEKIREDEQAMADLGQAAAFVEEIPLPEGKVVEFSPDAEGQEAAKLEMLDYLRARGVVVEGKSAAEVEQELANRLGIPRGAL